MRVAMSQVFVLFPTPNDPRVASLRRWAPRCSVERLVVSHPCPSASVDGLIALLASPPTTSNLKMFSQRFHGRSGQGGRWCSEEDAVIEDLICFSKEVHRRLTIRVTGSWGDLLSHQTPFQRGKRERRGLGLCPANALPWEGFNVYCMYAKGGL